MFSAFATPYTIHFDDTMAYGSHHFLTGFKFQCQARESLLYGDLIFDRPEVPEALNAVHLFTADAYNRNLNPAYLGDRLVILLTLEDWGKVSARFCYRVMNQRGQPVAAGFQNHVCADPQSGQPRPLPEPLQAAFDEIRRITERAAQPSFRDLVLAGGEKTRLLFSPEIQQLAAAFLADRHPHARIVDGPPNARSGSGTSPEVEVAAGPVADGDLNQPASVVRVEASRQQKATADPAVEPPPMIARMDERPEVWFFPGQGAFDAQLFSRLLREQAQPSESWRERLRHCPSRLRALTEGDLPSFFSGDPAICAAAVAATPGLSQWGIFLQGVMAAHRRLAMRQPGILVGHSLGELAALTVAGSLDFWDALIAVAQRSRHIEQLGMADGGLLAVLASRSQVAEELDVWDFPAVVIAGRNHEQQTLLSGPRRDLAAARQRWEQQGVRSIEISSPAAFHHPNLFPAAQAWHADLQALTFRPPRFTVYSVIGRRAVTHESDLPTLLSGQLLRPFDLQGVIDDLALVGFRDLIDCGSSGVLARLLVAASPTYMRCVRGCDFEDAASRKERSTQARRTASQRLATGATAPQGRPTIVITGQGCLLPGGANSPAALHQTLQQQRSGIEDLRQSDPQWEADFFSAQLQPDRATSGLSGRVREADLSPSPDLDPRWFESLSRPQQIFALAVQQCRAALADDPEVLCLIGATADGFEDQDRVAALRFAGIDPQSPGIRSALAEKAGALLSPYEALLVVLQKLLPGRVRLRLLDAACASSLYAVAQGMSALENRQARVVLVGGVYCPGPGNNCLFSQFKGLTDSECRPFDAQASGVVFAEGAAMLVMRRAEDCSDSDEPPLAIVRGVGLSSDGRSPSANVPKSAGQILALQRCYENYKIDPASISAIEGHGTATPTGDATEVRTLANFFASHVSAPIPLHSMKGLIGHTGWAAGTAAIVAAVQALTRQRLPGQANWSQPSPAIVAASQVLTVSPNPTPLPLDKRRIAVDGFGFGGANAHVVIEPWGTDHPKLVEANPSPQTSAESRAVAQSDDELVVVADYSLGTAENARACALPADMVVLPDLVDEMDDSQRMAVALTHGVLQQLAGFDEADRRETSIVLALAGKTQRACEATLRILGPRLARHLPADIAARLMGKFAQSRPSGPYTLQCMMPNVAAGRAALLLNLNGPNYVIDAGPESADALVEAAQWLLRAGSKAGTRLVVLGQLPSFSALGNPEGDFAKPSEPQRCTAIGVTTRALAQAHGWKIVRAVGASPAEFAGTTVPLEPSGSGRRKSPMRWVQSNCRTTSPQRPAQGLSPRPASVSASVPVSVIAVPSQQWSMLQADGGPLLDAAALVVLLGPSCHGRIPVNGRSVAEFQAAAMGSVDNVRRRLASLSAFELVSWQRVSPDWDAAGFQRELGLLHDLASQTQVDGTDKLVGIWSVMGNVPIGGETEAGERFQSLLAAGRPRPVPCRLLLSSAGEFATVLRQWQRERGEFAEFATWYRGAERYVGRSLATREKSAWELPELPASVPAHAAALWEFPFHLDDWGIVDFHQARGVPTIPGAWIIDQMVACVLQAAGVTAREVEIENVRFLKFAKALPSLQTDYRILIAAADAGFHAWLLGDITNPQGLVLKRDEVFATATLRPKSGSSMRSLTPASNQAGSFERRVRDPYCNRRESIQLSGPFDCLEQIEIGGHGRRARFNPKVERAWRETVPALAIDAAIRVAGMHVAEQGLHVPTSISRLVVPVGLSGWTLADADWQIVAGHPRSDGREIYCGPVNVVDGDGRVRATIEGAVVSQLS